MNADSPHNASGCADTDGFLENSASGGVLYYKGPALQKIIPDPPWIDHLYSLNTNILQKREKEILNIGTAVTQPL